MYTAASLPLTHFFSLKAKNTMPDGEVEYQFCSSSNLPHSILPHPPTYVILGKITRCKHPLNDDMPMTIQLYRPITPTFESRNFITVFAFMGWLIFSGYTFN
ncbi:hypothetical protein AX774_g6053 [Zancudomyces culisetae]|uniref:Uncharacterized protein n=1 Tax=Zancudomyces culisetae TaxID=1213189 RepID=A0A1R1PHT3_ZANCU|nr:hypothetical protein AX774_g6053 [Zancudomyces culisetae]|eukprot:OMH80507.1 hypothetical protein AX774_g6053 [Zancudomyces culisetae]